MSGIDIDKGSVCENHTDMLGVSQASNESEALCESSLVMNGTETSDEQFVDNVSVESETPPQVTNIEDYLSKLLNELQKKQENEKGDLLQLLMKQQQEYQTENFAHSQSIQYPPIISNSGKISPVSSTAWTFTQGLILGQLSVIILVVAFIKFFVFTEAAPTQASTIPLKSNISVIKTNKTGDDIDTLTRVNTLNEDMNHQREVNQVLGTSNIRLDSNSTLTSILEKTYYDVKTHKAESLDWFNVLVAQIISQARLEALNDGNIYESLDKALNSPQVLQYFDRMKISEINIGDDYPIFSNCRVKNNEGRLEAKIDVDVSDTITLGVETNLLVNQPKFMSASLPIKLSISVVRFSACLTVSLITIDNDDEHDKNGNENTSDGVENSNNGNTNDVNTNNIINDAHVTMTPEDSERGFLNGAHTDSSDSNRESILNNGEGENGKGHSIALMFSFSPDFRLEFETKSLIGSRAKLENIPRISSILENVIRKWFIERCIEPRFQLIKLPSMWPRKKNTRENVPTE